MSDVLRLTDAAHDMSLDDVAALIPAPRTWTRAIGVIPMLRHLSDESYCLHHRHLARVAYTVRTTYTLTGKDVWLDLLVHNRTDRPLYGIVDGSASRQLVTSRPGPRY